MTDAAKEYGRLWLEYTKSEMLPNPPLAECLDKLWQEMTAEERQAFNNRTTEQ